MTVASSLSNRWFILTILASKQSVSHKPRFFNVVVFCSNTQIKFTDGNFINTTLFVGLISTACLIYRLPEICCKEGLSLVLQRSNSRSHGKSTMKHPLAFCTSLNLEGKDYSLSPPACLPASSLFLSHRRVLFHMEDSFRHDRTLEKISESRMSERHQCSCQDTKHFFKLSMRKNVAIRENKHLQ